MNFDPPIGAGRGGVLGTGNHVGGVTRAESARAPEVSLLRSEVRCSQRDVLLLRNAHKSRTAGRCCAAENMGVEGGE